MEINRYMKRHKYRLAMPQIPPLLSAAGLIILSALLSFASGCARFGHKAEIIELVNPEIKRSSWPFLFEHWKEEKLAELREREGLESLEKGIDDEFTILTRAMSWTNQQWKHSIPDPYPLCNAINILDDIRAGRTGGFCGQYSYVLADVLKSIGFYAVRYVELTDPKGRGHFVVEAWSNQYAKWAVLDPDYNIYYKNPDGTPMNALEIHNAFEEDRVNDVTVVKVKPQPTVVSIDREPLKLTQYYDLFAVSLRSDLMRQKKPLTIQDRLDMFLAWGGKRKSRKRIMYRQASARVADFYYTMNSLRILPEIRDDGTIKVTLDTESTTPNFKFFMVKVDNEQWKPSPYEFTWSPDPGVHTLLAAPYNEGGNMGALSMMKVRVK